MTAQRAHRAGCTRPFSTGGDIVTECAHSNVSVLKDGVLYSHPNDEFILRGIAKSHMIRVCYRLGIPVLEKPFTMDFLKSADEILVTSTKFCLAADTLNGRAWAGGCLPPASPSKTQSSRLPGLHRLCRGWILKKAPAVNYERARRNPACALC